MIYILSGEIRTGKTSALKNWAAHRNDVDGLVCPDNAEGKRYFFELKSKTKFALEVETESANETISIGPFLFLKAAFDRANAFLKTLVRAENKYLIIDELGKLELKDRGLDEAAKLLIPNFINHKEKHLIVVIRDTLLEDTIKHYTISNYQLITKAYLKVL